MPADDQLDAQLRAGLRSELRARPVDAEALFTGSRRRAERIRSRRVAASAVAVMALVAVVTLPFGIRASHDRDDASASAVLADPPVAYPIPDDVAPDDVGLPLTLDTRQNAGLSPVAGATCGTGGTRPVAGRAWQWSEGDDDLVALTVTGWRHATLVFRGLPEACGTGGPLTRSVKLRHADDALFGTRQRGAALETPIVVVVGDLIGGIEVRQSDGDRSRTRARDLADQVAERLAQVPTG